MLPEDDPELEPEPEDDVPEDDVPLELVPLLPLELVLPELPVLPDVPFDVLPLPLLVVLPDDPVVPLLDDVPELVPLVPELLPVVLPVLEEPFGEDVPPVSVVGSPGRPAAPGIEVELAEPPPVVEDDPLFPSVEAVMSAPPAPPLDEPDLCRRRSRTTGVRSRSTEVAGTAGVCRSDVADDAAGDATSEAGGGR